MELPGVRIKCAYRDKGRPADKARPCEQKNGYAVFFVKHEAGAHQEINQAGPPEKRPAAQPIEDEGKELEKKQDVEKYELKPWKDPEDLATYLGPYQNNEPYEPDFGDFYDPR